MAVVKTTTKTKVLPRTSPADGRSASDSEKVSTTLAGMEKHKIVYLPIASLRHPDYNPRKIPDKKMTELKRSLVEFTAVNPAIVNAEIGRENMIIGGNQRVMAAKSLGWTEFPCVRVSVPIDKEKELNIRLNQGGEWDFGKLFAEFKIPELFDLGFSFSDLKGHGRKFDDLLREHGAEHVEKEGAQVKIKQDNAIMSFTDGGAVYCPISYGIFDVGHGYCRNACLYCFARICRGGDRQVHGTYRLTSISTINKMVTTAKTMGTVLTIGNMIDPMLPELRGRVMHLLDQCKKFSQPISIATKLPKSLLSAVVESGIDPRLVIAKIAFSFCTDEKSSVIEPGAPIWSDRLAGMVECAQMGIDTVLRLHPFFIDYYEGFAETMDAVSDKKLGRGKGCSRVMVCPIRVSLVAIRDFTALNPVLDKDKNDIMVYLRRVGGGRANFGAIQWFDYGYTELHSAYASIRNMGKKYGMNFGISSPEHGPEHLDLCDGDFCCQTDKQKERGDRCDQKSLVSLFKTGAIKDYIVPALSHSDFDNDGEYRLMCERIQTINNHVFKMPVSVSEKK